MTGDEVLSLGLFLFGQVTVEQRCHPVYKMLQSPDITCIIHDIL